MFIAGEVVFAFCSGVRDTLTLKLCWFRSDLTCSTLFNSKKKNLLKLPVCDPSLDSCSLPPSLSPTLRVINKMLGGRRVAGM